MTGTDSRDLGFSDPQPVIEVTHKGKKRTYAVIDYDLAFRLGLNEETDRFEQAIGDDGELVLKLKRKGAEA